MDHFSGTRSGAYCTGSHLLCYEPLIKDDLNNKTKQNRTRHKKKKKPRILRFSAYALTIFTEYTAWAAFGVVLVPITNHIPSFINVAHTELWIFDFFVISQSEQICKWGIKYVHSVMTDHMGSTCAHHYPHTKFHQCSPYRTLDIWLFCY